LTAATEAPEATSTDVKRTLGSDVGCRGCVKAHKAALMAQRAFWRSVLDDKLKLSTLLLQLGYLHKAEQKALTMYKR